MASLVFCLKDNVEPRRVLNDVTTIMMINVGLAETQPRQLVGAWLTPSKCVSFSRKSARCKIFSVLPGRRQTSAARPVPADN